MCFIALSVDDEQHPLQNRWVLWYDNPKKRNSNESWEENLKNVYTFNTVEDFWWYVVRQFVWWRIGELCGKSMDLCGGR